MFLPTVQKRSLFSTPSLAFIVCIFFDDGHSDWCEVIPYCTFDLYFSNVECIFMCHLANWMSSLEKCPFRSPVHFLIWLCVCVCFNIGLHELFVHCGDPGQLLQFSSVAQLCLTLCDPMDYSVPGFLVHHKLPEKVKVKLLSHVRLFATPWTIAYQALPSLGFSRQEYCNGLPFPSPGDFPNPGIEPGSPTL